MSLYFYSVVFMFYCKGSLLSCGFSGMLGSGFSFLLLDFSGWMKVKGGSPMLSNVLPGLETHFKGRMCFCLT